MSYKENVTEDDGAEVVPTFRAELGSRILRVIELYRTKAEAAAIGGVRVEQLAHYANGRAKPPFEVLMRLAAPHQVSLDWLATGKGEMRQQPPAPPQAVDGEVLRGVVEAVEEYLEDYRLDLDPGPKSGLILALYQICLETQQRRVSSETLHAMFNLARGGG